MIFHNILHLTIADLAPIASRCRLVPDRDRGQTTAEYALVLLGAATVALLLVAWATGSGKIDQLFNTVFDHLISKAR